MSCMHLARTKNLRMARALLARHKRFAAELPRARAKLQELLRELPDVPGNFVQLAKAALQDMAQRKHVLRGGGCCCSLPPDQPCYLRVLCVYAGQEDRQGPRQQQQALLQLFAVALRLVEAPVVQQLAEHALPDASNPNRTIATARLIAGLADGRLARLHELATGAAADASSNRCVAHRRPAHSTPQFSSVTIIAAEATVCIICCCVRCVMPMQV